MYDVNRAFKLLKKISFERVGGSEKEKEAANILQNELIDLGYLPYEEEFEVDYSQIVDASLEVLEPTQKKYEVTGVKMTGSTPKNGITAELVYIEDANDANLEYIEGKIVLINSRIIHNIYKKLVTKKPAGFICISGTIYDEKKDTDLDVFSIREKDYELGKIPGVTIRAIDAQELLEKQAKTVKITLIQNESKATSRNVVCDITGTTYPDKIICVTAHYDSVQFSTGAYDNASGSVAIMELFHHFSINKPKRTLRFIWCGSEELGLRGSKAHVKLHESELNNYLYCLNVDMVGVILGKEIAVSTAEMSLVNYISFLANEIGVAIQSTQGVYSSDSTPFADANIPATSFARISPAGGAKIHSRKDVLFPLNANSFESSLKVMVEFLSRIANSIIFPISKKIPENMKTELDYYNQRAERPTYK